MLLKLRRTGGPAGDASLGGACGGKVAAKDDAVAASSYSCC